MISFACPKCGAVENQYSVSVGGNPVLKLEEENYQLKQDIRELIEIADSMYQFIDRDGLSMGVFNEAHKEVQSLAEKYK